MTCYRTTCVLAGAIALSVAGCDATGDDEEQNPELIPTVTEPLVAFDPLARDYPLTPEQRTRRSRFDQESFEAEYSRYREEMSRTQQPDQTATPDTAGSASAPANSATPSAQRRAPSGWRPRSEMDFAFLDRNSDGRLSVAEYAIWAIPIDPNEPKPNDQRKPYITADQANKAADSIFYYDTDGSTYLSDEEFAIARTGGAPG